MNGSGTVFVTGAAQGIGRSIAVALADAGWAVAACDREERVLETATVLRDAGARAAGFVFDVTDADGAREAYTRAEAELGPVGAVVSNAAIVDQIVPAGHLDAGDWRREIDVNLTGAFLCIQPALDAMRTRGWGRIVVISSASARGGLRGQVAYTASKAGLIGMVRTLALELAPDGVTVNAVLPGMVETEKVRAMPASVRRRVLGHVPMRRFAEPAEVASAVVFLCSAGASYVTGVALPVDGGINLTDITLGPERRTG